MKNTFVVLPAGSCQGLSKWWPLPPCLALSCNWVFRSPTGSRAQHHPCVRSSRHGPHPLGPNNHQDFNSKGGWGASSCVPSSWCCLVDFFSALKPVLGSFATSAQARQGGWFPQSNFHPVRVVRLLERDVRLANLNERRRRSTMVGVRVGLGAFQSSSKLSQLKKPMILGK